MTTFMDLTLEHDGIDLNRTSTTEQWAIEAFEKMVRPLLEAGVSIRWEQYTPYFNDGDICEFSVGEPRFRISDVDENEDGDYEDGFVDTYSVQLKGGDEVRYEREYYGEKNYWGGQAYRYVDIPTGRTFEQHTAFEQMQELELAMNRGHFEELLYETFGDHARVTITPGMVVKECFSHE